MAISMPLPKEIQDLIDYLNEEEPFEAMKPNLSETILTETSLKWLTIAIERAKINPRLVNRPEETVRKLMDIARQFAWLKEEKPSK